MSNFFDPSCHLIHCRVLEVELILLVYAADVHMYLLRIYKKYKLDLKNPTVDEVAAWIEKIG